jgi:aarF domain-containing kinase
LRRAFAALAEPGGGDDLVAWSERERALGGGDAAALSWPAPLSAPQRLARSARFWRTAAPLVLRYALLTATHAPPAAWDAAHAAGAADVASALSSLRGFFVKAAQLVATRPDLFPPAYAAALAPFTDALPPMPARLLVRVIESELGAPLSTLFSSFDAAPLGSASVAQVHRAVLRSDGALVAVKVQRVAIEPLLRGDVATLISLADATQRADFGALLRTLEASLSLEFDFEQEAAAMTRVRALLAADGAAPPPVHVPCPILATRRCLVMQFVDGTPVSRLLAAQQAAQADGSGGVAQRAVSRALLRALSDAYGATMLREGLLHGDPHPGNVMLCADGRVALIDWGLTAQLAPPVRKQLAQLLLLVDAASGSSSGGVDRGSTVRLAAAVRALGFAFRDDCAAPDAAAASLAMWLFGSSDAAEGTLPGGFSGRDLSRSPLAQLAAFPPPLVLVFRAAVLIRGMAARAGVPWALAREWAPAARAALAPPPAKHAAEQQLQQRRGGLGAALARFVRAALAALLGALRRWALAAAGAAAARRAPHAVAATSHADG